MFSQSSYKYKKTIIGEIPSDWEVVEFCECLNKEKVKIPPSIPRNEYQRIGKYPIIDQSMNFISGYTDQEDKVFKNPLPVIIFGDHTRIFKFINFPFAIGADGTKILFPRSEILEPKYLYFFFLSLNIPSKGYNRHFKILKEQNIVIPPLPEQKKIAFVLSAVQDAIEKTEKVIQATKELKKSLMKHLFTYGAVSPKDAENVKLKETEIGPIPENWEVVRLGEVAEIRSGGTPSKKRKIILGRRNYTLD